MRKQGKYTNATVLLRHHLLIPHLVPIVPGAVLVVGFDPRVGQTGAASGTSRGAHQPGTVNDAILGTGLSNLPTNIRY